MLTLVKDKSLRHSVSVQLKNFNVLFYNGMKVFNNGT